MRRATSSGATGAGWGKGMRFLVGAATALVACAKGGAIPPTAMSDGGQPFVTAVGHTPESAVAVAGTAPPSTSTASPTQPTVGAPTTQQPPPPSPTVRFTIKTSPAQKRNKCKVYWGKKLLGSTPLQFERPRDSGPLDLVVRAEDAFPVHVRVFTFKNDLITVQITKLVDKMKLFGAREEVAPPPDSTAGTPPGATPVPPTMGGPAPTTPGAPATAPATPPSPPNK